MRFWLKAGGAYALALALGLLLPAAALLVHPPRAAVHLAGTVLGAAMLAVASGMLSLMLARALFPHAWWLSRVEGQDVYEFQGQYFIGRRLNRLSSRVQRLLFSADERFHRWDMGFGLLFLLLVVPHGLAAWSSYRALDARLPQAILLPETLHFATLNAFPVLASLGQPWSDQPAFRDQVAQQARQLLQKPGKSPRDWFALAQLQLLRAFHPRQNATDPYTFSPADALYFERGAGSEGLDDLNQILAAPPERREGLTAGTWALVGFFQLCDTQYRLAASSLTMALAQPAEQDRSGLPRPLVTLLAAQAWLLEGRPERARPLLEALLTGQPAAPAWEGLALEHLAEALRLQEDGHVAEVLDQAMAVYMRQGDAAGMARVHLRRAVLLAERHEPAGALREVSLASSQATQGADVFTRDMVVRLTHLLPPTS